MKTTDDLRAWRAAKRWTQARAAEELGYTESGFQKIEMPIGVALDRRIILMVAGYEAMAVAAPGAPIALLTTAGDLSDEENIKQCEYELRRLTGADWAAKWGEAILTGLRSAADAREDAREDVKEEIGTANEASREAAKEADELRTELRETEALYNKLYAAAEVVVATQGSAGVPGGGFGAALADLGDLL